MNFIQSKDGTQIAYEQRGRGPQLLLVHGTGIDHTYWEPVATKLEQHFTVCTIDRRGRGESGDTQPYAIEREFEDVAAVIDALSGPVYVVGHSYGAFCSLEAALLTQNIHKLILYEPPIYTTIKFAYPPDAFQRFDAYIKAGEYEKALLMVYAIGNAPAVELEMQKSQPNWANRLAVTPTLRREILGAMNYHFNLERFRGFKTPTLLLQGSDTSPFYKAATEAVHKALPGSRVTVLPRQGHEAVVTAPELFLREVFGFFEPTQPVLH